MSGLPRESYRNRLLKLLLPALRHTLRAASRNAEKNTNITRKLSLGRALVRYGGATLAFLSSFATRRLARAVEGEGRRAGLAYRECVVGGSAGFDELKGEVVWKTTTGFLPGAGAGLCEAEAVLLYLVRLRGRS